MVFLQGVELQSSSIVEPIFFKTSKNTDIYYKILSLCWKYGKLWIHLSVDISEKFHQIYNIWQSMSELLNFYRILSQH